MMTAGRRQPSETVSNHRGLIVSKAIGKLDLSLIEAGYEFPTLELVISDEAAAAYRAATGDPVAFEGFPDVVHPLQLDAAAIARLIEALGIVEGRLETVHAGQQMTLHRMPVVGERISCASRLVSNNLRRGARWATIESEFRAADGVLVAESSSTLILLPDEK